MNKEAEISFSSLIQLKYLSFKTDMRWTDVTNTCNLWTCATSS